MALTLLDSINAALRVTMLALSVSVVEVVLQPSKGRSYCHCFHAKVTLLCTPRVNNVSGHLTLGHERSMIVNGTRVTTL